MLQFSIIIPTYNRAQLLERCLRSIIACQLNDIEILVADNASTDATQEVLKSFSDPRIKFWCNKTNVGAERNILNLLKAAQGEWVSCLTDDDFLLPNALEHLFKIVQSDSDTGVILSSLKIVDQTENYLWTYHFYKETAKFSAGIEALSRMVWAAHVFSRITVRRKWLDLKGTERHLVSMYPQMYFVGAILKEHAGFYLDECLVAHTAGNHVFWEYPKDFMVRTRIRMIIDMLPGKRWRKERQVLIEQIIDEIAKHLPLSWDKSITSWFIHQVTLLHNQEIVFSYRYWRSVFIFLIRKVARKLKTLVSKYAM